MNLQDYNDAQVEFQSELQSKANAIYVSFMNDLNKNPDDFIIRNEALSFLVKRKNKKESYLITWNHAEYKLIENYLSYKNRKFLSELFENPNEYTVKRTLEIDDGDFNSQYFCNLETHNSVDRISAIDSRTYNKIYAMAEPFTILQHLKLAFGPSQYFLKVSRKNNETIKEEKHEFK